MDGGDAEAGAADRGESGGFTSGWIDHIIGAYGVARFFADIDRGRDFRAQGGVFGAVLDHAANEGFGHLMERYNQDRHETAIAFRQRHLIDLLKRLA